MIDGKRVLALIPARKGSKGLPLKNIRPLAGKPLLAWPIEAARACPLVDRVLISTDDPEFAEIAVSYGADAPFLRPKELASDTAPSIDFILHALGQMEAAGEPYDYLVLLEPTSPLTTSKDISNALEQLHANRNIADSIVGVSQMVSTHPAFAVIRRANHSLRPYESDSFSDLPRRQDTQEVLALDGSLYISDTASLHRTRAFCHDRTLGFETARYQALEVDDLVDFICIEAILNNLELVRMADRSEPEES